MVVARGSINLALTLTLTLALALTLPRLEALGFETAVFDEAAQAGDQL